MAFISMYTPLKEKEGKISGVVYPAEWHGTTGLGL
jgi:hypothetical protein